MGYDAGGQAAGPIGDEIVERAADQRRDPIGPGMGEAESDGDGDEREPRKGSDRDAGKSFVDQITEEKTAPKHFFDKRNDDHQPEKSKNDCAPIQRWFRGEKVRIETGQPRFKAKELLRCNPKRKDRDAYKKCEPNLSRRPKFIVAPEPKQKRATDQGLRGVRPVSRIRKPGNAFWP